MARTKRIEHEDSEFPNLYSFKDKGYKYVIDVDNETVTIEAIVEIQ